MFFGSLEDDVERLQRVNRTLSIINPEKVTKGSDQLRPIQLLSFHPSVDLGTLAADQFSSFPLTLRHLLKGLGVSEERGWDLLSYLAFDGSYTKLLIQLGREDALRRRHEIEEFFSGAR
jgi:NTE family protein